MSFSNLFDLNGRQTANYLTNGGGSWRDRFGTSFNSEDDNRRIEFKEADMARTSNNVAKQLDKMKVQAVEMSEGDLVATTGQGRSREARTVEQRGPMDNNVQFRLAAPIRA